MKKTKIKPIKFGKEIYRINILTMRYDPEVAFREAEKMKLPKHRAMGYEIVKYKGRKPFTTIPVIYILK